MGRSLYTSEQVALARLLGDLRRRAGLTQAELAERLGRPQSWVSKYESGQRRIDLLELRLIGDALGVTLIKLVREFEKRARTSATDA